MKTLCDFASVFIYAGTRDALDGAPSDQRLWGERGTEERNDSDGGGKDRGMTGNPSEG